MKSMFAVLMLAVSLSAFAQEKTDPVHAVVAPKPVETSAPAAPKVEAVRFNADEHSHLRDLQVKKMKAYDAVIAANEAFKEADKELQAGVQELYTKHGLDVNQDPLCDGPVSADCADVKVDEIIAKKMPVQQAKK